MPFKEFFKIHLKMIYRNRAGIFWTVIIPVAIYVAVSSLPLGQVINADIDYPKYLLPGIIAMVVMQGGIYTLAYAIIELKSRGVLKRLAVTPLTKTQFILSLMAARLTVVLIQVFVLTVIGVLIFNTQFTWRGITIATFVLLGGAIFLLMGLVISTFANTYESAAPITAGIGLPLAFLGNIFYPAEQLPPALHSIANFLPITYLADGLRQSYIYGAGISDLTWQLFVLSIWFIAFFILATWRFKLED
ncbi:MAG TPA: ABC transporter permease [Verrucomicrobiae bacterium]|nr:ABC transporter permease [Verrucomicrobiae bacterium]